MLPNAHIIDYRKADLDSFLPGELQSSSLRPKVRTREVSSSGFDINAKKAYYSKINQKLLNADYYKRNSPHYSRRPKGPAEPDPFRPTTGSLALRTIDDTFEHEDKWQRRTMQAYVRATSPVTQYPRIQDSVTSSDPQSDMAGTIKNYSKLSCKMNSSDNNSSMYKPFPHHKSHRHCCEEDHRGLSPMEKHNILPELRRLEKLQERREAGTASRPATIPGTKPPTRGMDNASRTTGKFHRVATPLPKYRLHGAAEVWENIQDTPPEAMDSGFSQLKIKSPEEPLSNLTSARFTFTDADGSEEGFVPSQVFWEGDESPEETFAAASRKTYRSGLLRTTTSSHQRRVRMSGGKSGAAHVGSPRQGDWYCVGNARPPMQNLSSPRQHLNSTRMSSITTPSLMMDTERSRFQDSGFMDTGTGAVGGGWRNSISSHGRLQGVVEERSSQWKSKSRVEWPSYHQPRNAFVNTSEGPRKVVRVLDHTVSLPPEDEIPGDQEDSFKHSDDHITSMYSSKSSPALYTQTFEQRTKNLIEALT